VLEQVPQESLKAFRVEVTLGGGEVIASGTICPQGSELYRLAREQWQLDWSVQSRPGFRVVGEETVTVPHGTYSALRVDRLEAGGRVSATAWFVRGLGMVKLHNALTRITEALETTDLRS
jgi:hypothetical protein